MIPIRETLATSLTVLALLLAVLAGLGLPVLAAVAGMICGAVLCMSVPRGLGAVGATALGPADVVTLARSILTCALAALVVDPSHAEPAAGVILPLAVVSLALDAVDGPIARLTGTVSAFGNRFDGEADAFLLLVLSVHVAPSLGWWVLAIGGARYAFGLAGWADRRLRATLPFRFWRKVVTAVQGSALVVAIADVLPRTWTLALLVAALALLVESFGRDVLWLWRHHGTARQASIGQPGEAHLPLP